MRQRVRAWFRAEPPGIVITVGVVLGYAAFNVLADAMQSFVVPLLIAWRYPELHLGDVTFNYSFFVGGGLALLVLAAIVFYIFIADDLTPEELTETRDCPECKNEIWADATRCGFCTAVVEPVMPAAVPESPDQE